MENEEKILEVLSQFLDLYKLINKEKIDEALSEYITTEQMRQVYILSDGEKTMRDIGEKVGVSHMTVKSYWEKWSEVGIVNEAERSGRYKAKYNLE